MDSNNNAEMEMEQEECFLSDDSTNSIKSESSQSSATSQKLSNTDHNTSPDNSCPIKEVYASNFKEEIKNIKSIIEKEEYTYIGMDTEFPGIVYNLNNINNDFYYKTMKLNVESTKLIQLGITLTNKNGEFPKNIPYHTWQFNLQFDIDNDKYSEESINLLKGSGIDFENLKKNGINYKKFASGLINSGLVLNPKIKWISYQGSYDFAYLLKLIRNEQFPEKEKSFINNLKLYFPEFYDVRMLIKDNTNYFHGGLSRLISSLNIERKGINHQAGSDAIATIEAFHKLIKNENISNKTLKRFKNVLYGIGIGEDNQNTIKYINNSNNNINMNNVNNFKVSNRNPSNINNNTVFNQNMMYIQNQIKNNYMNNYIKCFYPCILINNAIKNNILMNQMKLAQAMMA